MSETRHDPAEFLAKHFAVREAAFKTLAPLTPGGVDFRIVETLSREDGSPYVNVGPELAEALEKAGVGELPVSITNEGGTATAVVLAQQRGRRGYSASAAAKAASSFSSSSGMDMMLSSVTTRGLSARNAVRSLPTT